MSIKKRHPIRDSEIRKIEKELSPELGEGVTSLLEGNVERAETEEGEVFILSDGRPALVREDEGYIPLLFTAEQLELKRITVDMGAVPPISDGADVMAPGIVEVDEEIEEGEIVGIEDEENRKLIAVGEAIKPGSDLQGDSGKVVKSLHYVGDRYWSLQEEF